MRADQAGRPPCNGHDRGYGDRPGESDDECRDPAADGNPAAQPQTNRDAGQLSIAWISGLRRTGLITRTCSSDMLLSLPDGVGVGPFIGVLRC